MSPGICLILKKMSIISMILMLCLPCTIKREIKKSFNIPVSEKTAKINQFSTCSGFLNEISGSTSSLLSKTIPKGQVRWYGATQKTVIADQCKTSNSSYGVVCPVPIFILHEQYLI